jgi:hypothetical protein
MYFVTTNRPGYVLFSMTPSERAAVGLTDKQSVHVLVREVATGDWAVAAEWSVKEFSHTELMAALHRADEPQDPLGLLEFVPERLRSNK